MDKRKFMSNAVMLVVTTFLLRLVFTAFRVIISNKVGAECMGLYQLTFAIYGISVTVATSGINFATTRLVSQAEARGKYSTKQIMGKCAIYALIFSVFAFVFVYIMADKIAIYILCDIRTALSLKIFAVSLPFISLSSAITGFFYALKRVKITLYSRIIEQIAQIAVFFAVFSASDPENVEQACAIIVLSSAISEIAGSIYLIVRAVFHKEKNRHKQSKIFKKICSIALPSALGAYLKSGLQTVENTLVPIGFRKFGASQSDALKGYGTLCSMVMPVLFFPSFVLSAFSMLLIPEITYAQALDKKSDIQKSTDFTIKLTLYFALIVSANFICFGTKLGDALYSSENAGELIEIMAPIIPFMYLDSIADGLLKGLGEYNKVLAYSTIDTVISIILIIFAVPRFGLYGYILVIYISTMLNSTLSVARLLKITENRLIFLKDIVSPFVIAFACAFASGKLAKLFSLAGAAEVCLGIIMSISMFMFALYNLNRNVYKTLVRAFSMFFAIFRKSNLMSAKSINNSHKDLGERRNHNADNRSAYREI